MSGRSTGKATGFHKNDQGNRKMPEKMATAVLRSAIFQLGNFHDLRAPERQYPSRKLTASLHGRGRAALPPPRSREKDVRQFLHMR